MADKENVLLLGYLTDDNEYPIEAVIAIPFRSSTLCLRKEDDVHTKLPEVLGLDETDLIIYPLSKVGQGTYLCIVKPGMRDKVRYALKGAVLWSDKNQVKKDLSEIKASRRDIFEKLIEQSSWHTDIESFVSML